MKCKKCQKTIPKGSKFCNHCGFNQQGCCFYQRPDGLFEKKITLNGKRVTFRGRTEEEIFIKINQYNESQVLGLTFDEAADRWHTEHWYTLSPTTQRGYKFAYEEIKKVFGSHYIKQITHKDISNYIKSLPKTYARKTCVTRLQLINMIFKFAITEDMCQSNPCEYVTVPKGHGSQKRRGPTDDEIKKIKSSIGTLYHDFDFGLLAVFFLYTGCRKGEALALTFGDINCKTKRITINKSVYYEHNEGKLKKPKTAAGVRKVIIPDYLLPLLPKGKKDEYVFSPTPSEPMRGHFFEKGWKKWQDDTGLELTAHQLRHGYATILHEADIPPKDAQALLGHADISTTLNVYTDVNEKRIKKTQSKLNQFLQ